MARVKTSRDNNIGTFFNCDYRKNVDDIHIQVL